MKYPVICTTSVTQESEGKVRVRASLAGADGTFDAVDQVFDEGTPLKVILHGIESVIARYSPTVWDLPPSFLFQIVSTQGSKPQKYTPTGAVDGVNCDFDFSTPFVSENLLFIVNGMIWNEGDDYTVISSTKVRATQAPASNSTILGVY